MACGSIESWHDRYPDKPNVISVSLTGTKEKEILKEKSGLTFLRIMMVRRTAFSTQRRLFHKILNSQMLWDMLQDKHWQTEQICQMQDRVVMKALKQNALGYFSLHFKYVQHSIYASYHTYCSILTCYSQSCPSNKNNKLCNNECKHIISKFKNFIFELMWQ